MYQQLDPESIESIEGPITLVVNYMRYSVHITGTYTQWYYSFTKNKLGLKDVKNIIIDS
jgi:hypothetical protein